MKVTNDKGQIETMAKLHITKVILQMSEEDFAFQAFKDEDVGADIYDHYIATMQKLKIEMLKGIL